jgi:hypothetical protein
MYSDTGNTTSLVLGFPIRTSSDQRSVGSSPRHIAASNVLHRLPVPRHPPCALKHLQHKNQKMSFKRNCTSMTHKNSTHPKAGATFCVLDARNHYPQIKHHTPPPKQGNNNQPPTSGSATPRGGYPSPVSPTGRRDDGPVVSKPNSVSDDFHPRCFPTGSTFVVHQTHTHYRWGPSTESPKITELPHNVGGPGSRGAP